jgi:hypothetical protein
MPDKRDFWMKMPDKKNLDQGKRILRRIPGFQGINAIRLKILQIQELSNLIKDNRFVVFPSCSGKGNDAALNREMVHEVVKEWIDYYGVVHLRRKTAAAIASPAGAILLYAPQALLRIPSSMEEYLSLVRRETRREIRVAEKQGYEFKEFVWNDHLDEIFEINTSKDVRQSEPMRGWYREPVQPRHHSKEELLYRKYYGGFKDGKLYTYFHFWVCGDYAIGKHIIGHAQHLKYGIMNGLISYAVRECIENSQIRWLYYGLWSKGSLCTFKQHAGFQGYDILLDLGGEQELLDYSRQKVKTIWRI